jgi:hypothetical protein
MGQRNTLDPGTGEALKQLDQELRPFWRAYGRPVEVHFRSAGATRQVAHQLGATPDGYIIVRTTGALYAVTPERWTEDLALLRAPDVNTRTVLIFYTLREEAIVV